MNVLLIGINAKFIQTNLAIRLLQAYARKWLPENIKDEIHVDFKEWNVNQSQRLILQDIFLSQSDIVLFSVYIWNRDCVFQIAEELRSIQPKLVIGFGGPEVSWSQDNVFYENGAVDFIISGEGERTFLEVLTSLYKNESILLIPGVSLRDDKSTGTSARIIKSNPRALISNLDDIPFPYENNLSEMSIANKIIYYESSRGCPFSCAYCLSSIEHTVRFYSLQRVLHDINIFLKARIPLVKFVDRTFNINTPRYVAIWEYIRDNYNGITTFHFEVTASLLNKQAYDVMKTMPENSIQLEIGIQSINKHTLQRIHRDSDISLLQQNILQIPDFIHVHVDLIAGLPGENLDSFKESFNFAFNLHPGMLQLGFLKILSGTEMEKIGKTENFTWSSRPPYEVLSTPDMAFSDFIQLKEIDHITDILYNSGLMPHTLQSFSDIGLSAYSVFSEIACFMRTWFPDRELYLPRKPFDLFTCIADLINSKLLDNHTYKFTMEWLRYDFLLQGKPGVFPAWYERRYNKQSHDSALLHHRILTDETTRRTAYAHTEYDEFIFDSHSPPVPKLFIYTNNQRKEKKAQVLNL